MLLKLKSINLTTFVVVLLIASLPFYSFRFLPGELALPHLFLILTAFLGIFKIFDGKFVYSKVDIFIFIYLFVIIFNIFLHNIYEKNFEASKTFFYVICYILLKQLYSSYKEDEKKLILYLGSCLGLISFFFLFVIIIYKNNVYSNLDTIIFFFYKAIFENYNLADDFEGNLMMRSVVGEAFALYTLILFSLKKPGSKNYLFILSFLFVILMQSLRSYLSVFTIIYKQKLLNSIFIIFIFFIFILFFSSTVTTTFTSGVFGNSDIGLLGNTRLLQMQYVLGEMSYKDLFIGHGFASKINNMYIHNFIFSSLYTLGIIGFFVSFGLVYSLLSSYSKFLFFKESNLEILLIIPILSLLVGSTVEGMFTIPSFIVLVIINTKRNF